MFLKKTAILCLRPPPLYERTILYFVELFSISFDKLNGATWSFNELLTCALVQAVFGYLVLTKWNRIIVQRTLLSQKTVKQFPQSFFSRKFK